MLEQLCHLVMASYSHVQNSHGLHRYHLHSYCIILLSDWLTIILQLSITVLLCIDYYHAYYNAGYNTRYNTCYNTCYDTCYNTYHDTMQYLSKYFIWYVSWSLFYTKYLFWYVSWYFFNAHLNTYHDTASPNMPLACDMLEEMS